MALYRVPASAEPKLIEHEATLQPHPSHKQEHMAEGTIKRLTDRGFGFIDTGDGNDIFFHMSSVVGTTFNDLHDGQKVSFEVGEGPKGPRAENVTPAD